MKQIILTSFNDILIKAVSISAVFLIVIFFSGPSRSEEPIQMNNEMFFTLGNSIDLRALGGQPAARLLTRMKGKGNRFGAQQKTRYCKIKKDSKKIQWVLNDLETGEIISRSANADKLFFGASVAKLFVAAALLNKQEGSLNKSQLNQLVRMIVVSDNRAWKELQRQVGNDGSNDSGREGVDQFIQKMGYADIKGFQGWLKKKDGARIHGNELNTLQLSKFLYDTYQHNYEGAEILWKVMHATRTGRSKIDKYTPSDVYIGGKTGTYHGHNESPETILQTSIKARNHAAVLTINNKYYGLSILTNTGSDEDVAILGGGLIREYLDAGERIECP